MRKIFAFLCMLMMVLTTTAQIRGTEIRVMVTPDHSDWNYSCGEKAKFVIQVYKAQCLLPGAVIDYEAGPEMYPDVKKENVTLKNGKLEVSGSMTKPGFYRVSVKAKVNGQTYTGLATAAFDREKIKPTAQMPADFQEYWENALKEAREIPLNPTMVLMPERCTEKVNVYHVSFQNMRWNSRTYGILCVPKAPGKYPALYRVPGAGIRPYYGDIQTAEKGAITLEIGIHGIPVTMQESYYNGLFAGPLANYWSVNLDDRDNNYYKRVFIGALRGVDFICSLPEYNGKTLGVTGASQGGMLSLVTAALDSRVTFLAGIHPAMCDHTASLQKQGCGWPHYFYYNQNPTQAQIEGSRYYEGINFARLIRAAAWFSWGYNDDVVAPTSMFAMYNTLNCQKEIHPYQETGHYWYQEQYDAWNDWCWKQMGL